MNIDDTLARNFLAILLKQELLYQMFRSKTFLIIVCILFAGSFTLFAQHLLQPSPIQGEPLGVKQGLSQGMTTCIYQDKEGYMWICTKDGLNRYDGYNIVTYRNNPNNPYSLPDNFCNATVEDDKGNFWVGTNTGGLFLFDKATERFYPVDAVNSKRNTGITEIQYLNGKLFLKTFTDILIIDVSDADVKNRGSKARLIFSYNQNQPNAQYRMDAKSISRFSSGYMPDNSIWVNVQDSIFYIQPNPDFSKYNTIAFSPELLGIKKNSIYPVFFFPVSGEPETVIMAFESNIIHFNKKTLQVNHRETISLKKQMVLNKYFQVNDGRVYNFIDSSLYVYNPKTRKLEFVPANRSGWPYGAAISFFTDANGIEWIGSPGFGIIKKDQRKQFFKSFKTTSGKDFLWKLLPDNIAHIPEILKTTYGINSAALDKNGIFWALLKNDPYHPTVQLVSYNIHSGLLTQHPGLAGQLISDCSIYNDTEDRLWVYYIDKAKKNQIARIDKNTGTISAVYSIPNDIERPELYVSQFYMDVEGILWLATINGLYSFDENNKAWKHWKNIPGSNNSLSTDKLLSICPDPILSNKYLWIGTEGAGFNRFDKTTGHCIGYTEKDGLPNNVTYCILSDSLNNLWISTNRGLSCFDIQKKTFRNFTEDDGLPGNEFNRYTSMRMQNGELMFGGVDGFVIFNPNEILQKQPAAPIVFTGVSISNKPINWKTDSINLEAPVGYAKTLTLKPGQNIFSISFATLEYRSNAKKMYKYKLDGFDKDWTNPGNKNEVTYTNLSPGTYTFYVMGANTDGVWNEKPISMKIVVLPYWYQTFLFKMAILLLLAATVYLLYRYRLRQGLKLEKLRNRIARDLHDEIGSTLSSISIYAASAKKVTAGNEKAENILSKINTGTSEMMEAMSDIVWAVNTGSGRFYDLANRVRSFAVQVTEAKSIDLRFTDNKDIPDLALNMEQRKNIYLICKEAISNAVKYSGCTLLEVLISKESRQIVIHIHDNGKGFELSKLETAEGAHSLGGNGIKNMKVRADEINAAFELHTCPGAGTSVKLIIPL